MEKRERVGGKLQPSREVLAAWSPDEKDGCSDEATYNDWRAGRACVDRERRNILVILRDVKSAGYLLQ